ncbi:MAG: hypothetical protein RLZZ500_2669 [Bacteroidota bacterium]|jgi:hypothetical protein
MKRLPILFFLLCSVTLWGQNRIDLARPTVIGHLDENHHLLWDVEKAQLLEQINTEMGPSTQPFVQIAWVEELNVRSKETLVFLELKSESGKRIFYKWIEQKGNQLLLGYSEDLKHQALSNFIVCEGPTNCAPELVYDGTSYDLACQKSTYFTTNSSCQRTVGRFTP